MTECYACAKLAELRAENSALRHARDLAGFSMVDMNGEVVG